MNKIYVSEKVNRILVDYITSLGCHIAFIASDNIVPEGLSSHPDIFMCKMGCNSQVPIVQSENKELGLKYPNHIAFNAACTGKFFIHNLKHTNERLLIVAKAMEMIMIDVKQGYSKCSTVIVDENSIITYDEGIAKACEEYRAQGLDVLLISPNHVILDGYNTGFIGGASGRIGKEVIFNGDLSAHPDFRRIVDFIESKGLKCKWFSEYPLTDIGSII